MTRTFAEYSQHSITLQLAFKALAVIVIRSAHKYFDAPTEDKVNIFKYELKKFITLFPDNIVSCCQDNSVHSKRTGSNQISGCAKKSRIETGDISHGITSDESVESWELMLQILKREKVFVDRKFTFSSYLEAGSDQIEVGTHIADVLQLDDWVAILRICTHYGIPVTVESPLAKLARSLPSLSSCTNKETFGQLKQYLDGVSLVNRTSLALTTDIPTASLASGDSGVSKMKSVLTGWNLQQERQVVRLAQAAASQESDNPFESLAYSATVLVPPIAWLKHSCMPSVHPEAVLCEGDNLLPLTYFFFFDFNQTQLYCLFTRFDHSDPKKNQKNNNSPKIRS